MRRATMVLSAAGIALALLSCTSPTSGGGTTTTPVKILMNIPKSVVSSSPSSNIVSKSVVGSVSASNGLGSGSSMVYMQVTSSITMLKSMVMSVAVEAVMDDALISQNNLSPSSATHSGKSVKITQALYDAVKASIPDELVGTMPFNVGDTFPAPDFVYNTSSVSPYSFSLSLTGNGMTETDYWTAQKAKFAVKFTMGTTTMVLANDTGSPQSSAFKIVDTSQGITTKSA